MMKSKLTILLALYCAASALGLHTPGALGWHVSEGLTLRRTFISKVFLATESMSFGDGDDRTVSQRIFDLQTVTTLRTSCQFKKVGEGRPLVLRRFYDEARIEARSEVSGGRQQTRGIDYRAESPFEGRSVVFTWIPEDQEYGCYYDGLEGIEEALAGLREDLGARSLMPAKAVAEGDTWNLPPAVLEDLLAPGGHLGHDFGEANDPLIARSLGQGVGANLQRAFGGNESGTLKAQWVRSEEVEGRSLAVIALEFEAEVSNDIAELVNEERAVSELASGQETLTAILTVGFKGSGFVRWDLAAGCLFDTVDLRSDLDLRFDKTVACERDGKTEQIQQSLQMIGSILQECSVETED